MGTPQPFYNVRGQQPAYQLRYTWCGWPSAGEFPALPEEAWESLSEAWEADGMRLLERAPSSKRILLTFSTKPEVSPVFLAARAKGLLRHAFRECATPVPFSRKLAVRSVGENTADVVQKYIQSQVVSAQFLDARFADFLAEFTFADLKVDLSLPTETNSGRYWYNLHVVLVIDGRHRFSDKAVLRRIHEGTRRIAEKKGYRIGSFSVMPDHLHVALRGAVEQAPDAIALGFQNNLAFMVDRGAIWRPGFYVGTCGDYNMHAIRCRQRDESASPATQGRRGLTEDDQQG